MEITAPITLTPIEITAPITLGYGAVPTPVSTTPPENPTDGMRWYDPDFGVTASWDGVTWVTESEQPFGFVFGHSYCPDPGTLCTIPVYAAAEADNCHAGHPSVVYVPEGVSGYNYWMSMTPLRSSQDDFENPSIVVSTDGVTWAEPAGVTNPIVPAPASGFNADSNLTWDGEQFVMLYTEYTTAYKTFYLTSPNGIDWTAPALLRSTVPATAINASPSLYKAVDGTYMLWSVDVAASPRKVVLSTATTLDGPWTTVDCTIDAVIVNPWHLEVKRFGGQFVMLFNTEDTFGRHQLVWMRSLDGIAWEVHPEFVYPLAWNGDTGLTGYYKSTFVLGPHFGTGNAGRLWHTPTSFNTTKVADIKEIGDNDLGADYVSNGVAPLGETEIYDAFDKVDGALAGTLAETGQLWLAAGTQILIDTNQIKMGSLNSYAAIGLGASDGLVGVRFSVMHYDSKWELEARSQRNPSGGARRVGLQYQPKNFKILVYNGSTTTTYADWTPPNIDGMNLNGAEFTLQFVGRVVTARMNGRVLAEVTISESDEASLTGLTQVSLWMGDATTRIDRFFAHT